MEISRNVFKFVLQNILAGIFNEIIKNEKRTTWCKIKILFINHYKIKKIKLESYSCLNDTKI